MRFGIGFVSLGVIVCPLGLCSIGHEVWDWVCVPWGFQGYLMLEFIEMLMYALFLVLLCTCNDISFMWSFD